MMCAGWEGDNFVSSASIIYIVLLYFITLCYCVPWTTTRSQIRGTKSHSRTVQVVLKKSLTENFLENKTHQSCSRIIYRDLIQTKTRRLIVLISSSLDCFFTITGLLLTVMKYAVAHQRLVCSTEFRVCLSAQVIVIRVKMSGIVRPGCCLVMALMTANEVKQRHRAPLNEPPEQNGLQ